MIINPMVLSGKHILVTGASAGIGRATCVLASKLGARVSLVARNRERLQETLFMMEDASAHAIYFYDLTKTEGIASLTKQIVTAQGTVDGLAHCAGIGANRPIKLSDTVFMDLIMRANFYSFVELVRALSRKINSNDGASFIGISSVHAYQGGKSQGAYAASKGAISAAVPSMAKELASRKIRVNAVAFGMVDTGLYQAFIDMGVNGSDLLERQYLGIASPGDAANVLCYLLGPASRFITGTTLVADGGYLS